METQLGENHGMLFLYYIKITFILPAPTGRRLQPPGFTSTNWKEAPTRRRLQPPCPCPVLPPCNWHMNQLEINLISEFPLSWYPWPSYFLMIWVTVIFASFLVSRCLRCFMFRKIRRLWNVRLTVSKSTIGIKLYGLDLRSKRKTGLRVVDPAQTCSPFRFMPLVDTCPRRICTQDSLLELTDVHFSSPHELTTIRSGLTI